MKTTIVRYKTQPEHAEENAALVAEVFQALERQRPEGLCYEAVRSEDGLGFTHVVTVDDRLPQHPLTSLPEFQAFLAGLGKRCAEPPLQVKSSRLGRYPG
jgi:hypothetical protein